MFISSFPYYEIGVFLPYIHKAILSFGKYMSWYELEDGFTVLNPSWKIVHSKVLFTVF